MHQIAKIKKRRQELAGQNGGRRQTPRGSAASAPDARNEDRAQAGDPAQDHRRGHRPAAQTSQTALKRPDDRALFGLDEEPPGEGTDAAKVEPAAARPALVTARQKRLLAKLVEENPEFAPEFDVNLDEPGLERTLARRRRPR